jgi:hypothetical protein
MDLARCARAEEIQDIIGEGIGRGRCDRRWVVIDAEKREMEEEGRRRGVMKF